MVSAVKITVENDYDNVLPSLNLVVDVTDDFLVRLALCAGHDAAGPRQPRAVDDDQRLGQQPDRDVRQSRTSSPFEADAYDLSFEWYFAEESLLSLAFFYKDIGTFVSTSRDTRPFTGNPYGLPDELAIAACGTVPGCTPTRTGFSRVPINTPGGDLKGFEASYPAAVLVPADGFLGQLRR